MEALRRRAGRFGLDVILVNVWEGVGAADEAGRYCDTWGLEGPVLLDETAEYTRAVGVRGVPTNVFVNDRGVVTAVGATTSEQFIRTAATLAPGLLTEMKEMLGSNRTPGGFGGG